MSPEDTGTWYEANQRHLLAALAAVRRALERRARQRPAEAAEAAETDGPRRGSETAVPDSLAPPSLETLCSTFGLSPFERDLLLLCAGIELDATFAPLCAAAQGDPARPYPTFSLALAALPDPHWSALAPDAPLRRWRLIEVGAGGTLATSPLRIDEAILHYLAGVPLLDERLAWLVEPVEPPEDLVPSQRAHVERIVAAWAGAVGRAPLAIVELCGEDRAGKRAIAAAACAAIGLRLSRMPAALVPSAPAALETLMRLWEREAALGSRALLLDCEELDITDPHLGVAMRLVERTNGVLMVATRERHPALTRPVLSVDVQKPSTTEQRSIWQDSLGAVAAVLNGQVEALVSQFSLSVPSIRAATTEALGQAREGDLGLALWEACRVRARARLEGLAQRLEPRAGWDDLVLPEAQTEMLREMAAHVRRRATVYESWGFGARGPRGLGITALFAGPSGTGKTLAAEVLAHELHLDLFRIDLSSVVSKYIGETEKNLRRVFDAAEEGGAILLFDEADALFGKRTEVKDSHDRYANIEVSYLLQRMEAYRGLAILTTNMKSALDPAFLRRLRFVVQFPFPDEAQRAEIWRRVFPPDAPTENLAVERLARLGVSGGNIRNIALHAAFLAADAGEPIRMSHLLRAARTEYVKLERSLTESEVGGWV